jgi:hypothetical protein
MNALCHVNAVFGAASEPSTKTVDILVGAAGSVMAVGQPSPVNFQEGLLSTLSQQASSRVPPGRCRQAQVPSM